MHETTHFFGGSLGLSPIHSVVVNFENRQALQTALDEVPLALHVKVWALCGQRCP